MTDPLDFVDVTITRGVHIVKRTKKGGAVLRGVDGGGYTVDPGRLRDVAAHVGCDAEATAQPARARRAGIRIYGEPDRQLTNWIRTRNEASGSTG
ncbi:hypothetical protein [Streptomyces sp. NPDC001194]|uniref:hypothetical protein n=1 Tax=Streptomyces sp. NPDC001194 TaxID=3364547 RepID=UPI0036AA4F6A